MRANANGAHSLTGAEKARAFRVWAKSFPSDLPVLSLEDVSRESIYRQDWEVAILVDGNVLIFSILWSFSLLPVSQSVYSLRTSGSFGTSAHDLLTRMVWDFPSRRQSAVWGISIQSSRSFDTAAIYFEWRTLLVQHQVKGIQVHDARLVAGMKIHGIGQILTYNPKDFKRYGGITARHPGDVK
jgi:hypothetical protein